MNRRHEKEPLAEPVRASAARGIRAALLGLVASAALALVKLVSGLVGHSYALVADAIESFADIASSVIVWQGLAVARTPADVDHPYGHGKAEPLAAAAVAALLIASAVGISVQAVREIITPHHMPAAFTFWVLLGVVATKETLFRVVHRVGQATASGAVQADAWHHRSDAMTSGAAAIGIAVARLGGPGWEAADDWAALFACLVILANAVRIGRPAVQELMDAAPTDDIRGQVEAVARGFDEVKDVEKVLARKMGVSYVVDMHIEVDPDLTVRDAHEIAHRVKDAIRAAYPRIAEVLIHVEPHA